MRHGFDAATDSVRDTYSNEFQKQVQSKSQLHRHLLSWTEVSRDRSNRLNAKIGKEALIKAFKARTFVKCASRKFKQLRTDIYNRYTAGCRKYPSSIIEADC